MHIRRVSTWQKKVMAVTPGLCLFVFLLLGFQWDLWRYAWLVFLLIPFMPFLIGIKRIRFTFGLLITSIYLAIGLIWNGWHPWWILFILVPLFEILAAGTKQKDEAKQKIIINDEE